MNTSIVISLDVDFNLDPSDVFPDGEPDEWDASTVLALLQGDGWRQWDLLMTLPMQVQVFPARLDDTTTAYGDVRP